MSRLILNDYEIHADIPEILERLRLTMTNGKLKDIEYKSDEIIITCPNDEHKSGCEMHPDCHIALEKEGIPYGYFNCFGCSAKGTFLRFVALCFSSSEDRALDWLLKTFGGERISRSQLFNERISISNNFRSLGNSARKDLVDPKILQEYQDWCPYLSKRKLSREVCEKFNVKYDSKYRQVIFPCYDVSGNLIMIPKRSIDTKTFYLDKDVEKPVYCLNEIVKNNIKTAIVTEGPFDTLTAWTYGYPAIGMLGTPSDSQIEQLNRSCITTLYLMFDNDEAGRKFNQLFHKRISSRIFLVDVNIPSPYKDINDLDKETFLKIISNSK